MKIKIAGQFNDFVGLKIVNGSPEITFPYGVDIYDYNINVYKRNVKIKNLLKSILFTKSHFKDKGMINDIGVIKDNFPFFEMMWLLNNFISNGKYMEFVNVSSKNNGKKINWKKTISGDFYIQNNNIHFKDIYTVNRMKESKIITEIYIYCINISYRNLGWYYGNLEVPTSKYKIDKKNGNYFLSILNKKILNIFQDDIKYLYLVLIRIIECSNDNLDVNNALEIGIMEFSYTWEIMIDQLFSNQNSSKFNPTAKYYLENGQECSARSSLRPDTIYIEDDITLLIDSKYYKYGITSSSKDLPPVSDIQKQIVYGENIYKELNSNSNILNVFALPYSKKDNFFIGRSFSNNIAWAGVAKANWKEDNSRNRFERINLILIDMDYALDNFFRCTPRQMSKKLYETIIDKNDF